MTQNLSPETRANPTQTKSLQNSYISALTGLFKTYKKQALLALAQSRKLQIEPANIDIIRLSELLREAGYVFIVNHGASITADYVRKSYSSGTMYAGMTLKRIGVEAVIGEGPADWRVIDTLKVRNLAALRGINDEMNKTIISELTDGINRGESIPKLAKRITDSVNSIGIRRATVMARTETLYAFNTATEIRYGQAGIEKMEWLTAHDERLCPQCAPLDGEVFSIDSRHERPPLHPACRCTLIPVFK